MFYLLLVIHELNDLSHSGLRCIELLCLR